MTATLQPYPEYKDSGVPWLGRIPAHWEVLPLKRIAWFKSGSGFPVTSQGQSNLEIPFFRVSDMTIPGNDVFMKHETSSVTREEASKLGATVFPKGTIIFPKVGGALLTNKRRILTRPSCVDNNVMGCVATTETASFVFLLLRLIDLGKVCKPGPVPAIREGDIREIRVPWPPKAEQDAIVRFLHSIDIKVNHFIRNRRRLIEVLNEQKQAIINRAVTRGLDPNAPLRPSGVEWLGEIPAHWESRRMKFLVQNVNEQTATRQPNETYIALEHVEGWTGRVTLPSEEIAFDSQVKRFRAGDVLFGKLRPYLAKVTRPSVPGVCVGEFLVLRVNDAALLPEYLEQELRSKQFIDIINSSTCGAKMPRADWTFIGNLLIVYPPTEGEQLEIVSAIGRQTEALQSAIDRAKREIDLVREYRTRLIADVVTGKVDVRGLASTEPLPAENAGEMSEESDLADESARTDFPEELPSEEENA